MHCVLMAWHPRSRASQRLRKSVGSTAFRLTRLALSEDSMVSFPPPSGDSGISNIVCVYIERHGDRSQSKLVRFTVPDLQIGGPLRPRQSGNPNLRDQFARFELILLVWGLTWNVIKIIQFHESIVIPSS